MFTAGGIISPVKLAETGGTVESISEEIQVQISEFLKLTSKYLDEIHDVYNSVNPQAMLTDIQKTIEPIGDISAIETVANYITYINVFLKRLRLDTINIIGNEYYYRLYTRDKSDEFLAKLRARILKQWEGFDIDVSQKLIRLAEVAIDRFNVVGHVEENIRYLEAKQDPLNIFDIKIAEALIPFAGDRLAEIMNIHKNNTLETPVLRENLFLTRFNLVPENPFKSLAECFETLKIDTAQYDLDNPERHDAIFEEIANNAMICICVVYHCGRNIISYNIHNVISEAAARNLHATPITGVNKKIIARYNSTIETAGKHGDVNKYETRIYRPNIAMPKLRNIYQRNSALRCKRAIVLETQNMSTWRLWSYNSRRYIPGDVVKGIFNDAMLLPARYHELHEREILRSCFAEGNKLVVDKYLAVAPFPAPTIRENIIRGLMNLFDNRIHMNEEEFVKLVSGVEIARVVWSELFRTVGERSNPEFVLSYNVKFEEIIQSWKKIWARTPYQVSMEGIPAADRRAQFRIIFREIVDKVIRDMDRNRAFENLDVSFKEFTLEEDLVILTRASIV